VDDLLGVQLMPRIRTIKPDAFLSESLSDVPRGTRWTFAGLWTYADDRGRARDDVRLVKAALYPLDDSVSLSDVEDDLVMLSKMGGVCRYIVDGRRYLHMPNWGHQKINRPTESKLHEGGERGHVVSGDDSVSNHGEITDDSPWERKGTGKGKDYPSSADAEGDGSSLDSDFAAWYELYPRKVGKQAAVKAYRKAHKAAGAQALRDGLLRQLPMLREKAEQFRPHPATWLNEGRWEDEASSNVVHLPDGRIQLPPLPKGIFE
jgi:hypothetical protein